MVLSILLVSAVSLSHGADPAARFALTETTRSVTTKTVIQQISSSMTEESTSFQSQWKFEAAIPFSTADWTQLGQEGTVSLKIGKEAIEEKISASDGFDPKRHSYSFKLSKPVGVFSGFKYLTLPTDKPAPPPPAPGTRIVYGQGTLDFRDGTLKISFSTTGKSAPALAGENFVAVGDGDFEGELPLELTVGLQHQASELKISGTAKHRDTLNDHPMGTTAVGRIVQLSLTGKA